MKSKTTAYLLLIFLGLLGAHKFYLGKVGTGILYLFTGGLFGIGAFIDLFTLSGQVDVYNALFMGRTNMQNNNVPNQTVVVNVAAPYPTPSATPEAPQSSEQAK